MVGHREPHHQIAHSQTKYKLIRYQCGYPPAQFNRANSQNIPAENRENQYRVNNRPQNHLDRQRISHRRNAQRRDVCRK